MPQHLLGKRTNNYSAANINQKILSDHTSKFYLLLVDACTTNLQLEPESERKKQHASQPVSCCCVKAVSANNNYRKKRNNRCNCDSQATAEQQFTVCNIFLIDYAKLYNRAERFESKKVESR
jgi:hypothetical protein